MPRQATAPYRLLVILSTIVVALVLLLASAVEAGGSGDVGGPTVSYVVTRGDTLWEVAATHTPVSGDVRDTVVVIKELNRLDGSQITPGQVLSVPLLRE